MRKFPSIVALLAALVLFTSPKSALAWDNGAMNHQIDQTNFIVNAGCSGTLINLPNRLVLTASHCVGDQYETIEHEKIDDKGVVKKEKIRVLRPGTVTQLSFQSAMQVQRVIYRTKLLKVDKEKDLALLQIVEPNIPNVVSSNVSCVDPKRLDPVMVVGNPMGNLYSSANVGIVSSVQRDYGSLPFDNTNPDEGLMQITAGIIGGNSGGSVYNSAGELVGVPVLGNRVNEVVGFAVPRSVIQEFLADTEAKIVCP